MRVVPRSTTVGTFRRRARPIGNSFANLDRIARIARRRRARNVIPVPSTPVSAPSVVAGPSRRERVRRTLFRDSPPRSSVVLSRLRDSRANRIFDRPALRASARLVNRAILYRKPKRGRIRNVPQVRTPMPSPPQSFTPLPSPPQRRTNDPYQFLTTGDVVISTRDRRSPSQSSRSSLTGSPSRRSPIPRSVSRTSSPIPSFSGPSPRISSPRPRSQPDLNLDLPDISSPGSSGDGSTRQSVRSSGSRTIPRGAPDSISSSSGSSRSGVGIRGRRGRRRDVTIGPRSVFDPVENYNEVDPFRPPNPDEFLRRRSSYANLIRRVFTLRRRYRRNPVEVRYGADNRPYFVLRKRRFYEKVPTPYYPSNQPPSRNRIPMLGAWRGKNRLLRRLVALNRLKTYLSSNAVTPQLTPGDRRRARERTEAEMRKTKSKYDTYQVRSPEITNYSNALRVENIS